ncbi:hypothetical protein KSP24_01430 [Paenibacillus sp. AK121]|uniref:hypothetical protein n=1 Tax=Paenibacillus sp. AK121 TaxID=2849670 RepID=UPI001C220E26|nr:hypothetical protein [Paenibacillus sp. AK121]MBU9705586.1 hypothetical protein [Paenibacillus sp. AK121]
MSNNKFTKAFCVELGKAITPYFARELYFNESSEYYRKKMNYKCTTANCQAELYARCIYSDEGNKQVPHFAKKRTSAHSSKCKFSDEDYRVNTEESKRTNEVGIKISRFPSVFLLEGFSEKLAGIPIIEEEVEVGNKITVSRSNVGNDSSYKKSIIRTSLLDNLVDCFEKGDSKLIESQKLTIGSKTKRFKSFFKNIRFFRDEEDLIYYGKIKEMKKYGNNFKIVFDEHPFIDGKSLKASIYLSEKEINAFNKAKKFREQLDTLIASKIEVRCYFVGVNPLVKEVQTDKGSFKSVEIPVKNLNHLCFTFNDI